MDKVSIKNIIRKGTNLHIEVIIESSKQIDSNKIQFYLSDFEEIFEGKLKSYDKNLNQNKYYFIFSSCNIACFSSGILKICLNNNKNDKLYVNIYNLNYSEQIEEYEVADYFDEVENNEIDDIVFHNQNSGNDKSLHLLELDLNTDEDLDDLDLGDLDLGDLDLGLDLDDLDLDIDEDLDYLNLNRILEPNIDKYGFHVQTNGYKYDWLKIQIVQWGYTSNTNKLYFDLDLNYITEIGTVLDNFKVYVTSKNRNIFYSEKKGLTRTGDVPEIIDIHFNNGEHKFKIGPVFSIKEEDNIINPGVNLTITYSDLKQKYYVRRTFIYDNSTWTEYEILAFKF